jgi:proteasome lid subunit RPN8/RPN11
VLDSYSYAYDAKNIGLEHCTEGQQEMLFSVFEELKNIENRVAWFLAELCKGGKSLQKDKRNQRRRELVMGWVFSAPQYSPWV